MNLNTAKYAPAGHTFIEVMAALFIALITVAALFVGFQQGNYILTNTREDLRATQILLQKAEAIRLLTWPQLTNCPTAFQTFYFPAGTSTNVGIVYYGTLSTTGVATNIPGTISYQTNIHLITITVAWTNYYASGRAIAHSRQMQTLSALNGMQNYIYGGDTP